MCVYTYIYVYIRICIYMYVDVYIYIVYTLNNHSYDYHLDKCFSWEINMCNTSVTYSSRKGDNARSKAMLRVKW